MTQPDPCGASCEPAEDATAEARSHGVIWLGEQECFSWGVTAWSAVAAAVLVGWPVRVATRNRAPRSA